jgi:hypothetical protein
MTASNNLVAITPAGVLTDEYIAGFFFWYSIQEGSTPLPRVRKAFRDNGLDEARLPTERRPEHVFQEACRKVEGVVSNGHRVETRVEQVMRDTYTLIYQITRHVQDKANRVIEHPKALRVIFRFDDNTLTFEPLDGSSDDDVQPLVDQITEHYEKASTQVPGSKLRTVVRHYVEAAGAENMRGTSGGVYFLAKTNAIPAWSKLAGYHGDAVNGGEFIQRIRMMLEDIYGTAPNFHSIPCIDDEGQREFLRRKFIENCTEDLKTFRDECVELVRDKDKRERGYRSDKVTSMVNRRKELDMRRAKFAEILGETLEELEQDMKLTDKALGTFVSEAGA